MIIILVVNINDNGYFIIITIIMYSVKKKSNCLLKIVYLFVCLRLYTINSLKTNLNWPFYCLKGCVVLYA